MRNRYFIETCISLLVLCFSYQGMSAGPGTALEKSIIFGLPIRCTPGDNCWVVNYVDTDPAKSATDYACGHKVYNKHKGTDFSLRDLSVMQNGFQSQATKSRDSRNGVPVVAAAEGVVLGIRNGVPDINFRDRGGVMALKGRDCGNGVRIKHTGGWTTQYCHLRNGSVQVLKGQRIKAGQWLGFVGLSGRTEFPHLHFQVSLNKSIMDPFTGLPRGAGCGRSLNSLWNESARTQLTYRPTNIYMGGFVKGNPSSKFAREGHYHNAKISQMSESINLWADIFGLRKGDNLIFEIFAPDGARILASKVVIQRTQIRKFFSARKRKTQDLWPLGAYSGEIRLVRRPTKGKPKVYRFSKIIQIK